MSNREGDWMCSSCQHLNFKKRDFCQQCNCPKNATPPEISSCAAMQNTRAALLAGDWFCTNINCRGHNYASRFTCYRCGSSKEDSGLPDSIPGWKSGDWICSRFGCGMHNYASRAVCYKCKGPKASGEEANSSSTTHH